MSFGLIFRRHEITGDLAVYFCSLSSRTLVYKGMLTAPQVGEFFPELSDERLIRTQKVLGEVGATAPLPSEDELILV